MKEYLEILDSLNKKKTILTYEGLNSTVEMNESVKKNLICDIPEDYRVFLEQFDGGIIFKLDDFAGYKLFGRQEICLETKYQKDNFGDNWDDDIVLFGLCIGDNEYLGFKKMKNNEYKILHCIMELFPEDWIIISNSFEEFILILINERGKKFWLS